MISPQTPTRRGKDVIKRGSALRQCQLELIGKINVDARAHVSLFHNITL